MQTYGAVGNLAASFLGAAAGAAVGSHWGGSSYGHHSSWSSESNTFVDNTDESPPIGEWSDSGSSDYSGSSDDFSGGDSSGGFDE